MLDNVFQPPETNPHIGTNKNKRFHGDIPVYAGRYPLNEILNMPIVPLLLRASEPQGFSKLHGLGTPPDCCTIA